MARNTKYQRNKHTSANAGTKSTKKGKYEPKQDRFADKDRNNSANDPKWYATDPSLLRDAASFPFSHATGTPFSMSNPLLARYSMQDMHCVPGIASLYCAPSVGFTNDPTDPVNVAATSMYSFVRHANSGHSNYDSPDLMLYMLAMTQVYSYINYLQRVYATVSLYAQRNRYTPKALVQSMGVNYDDVIGKLADFRYRLNAFINKASSMAVPNNMSIFNRHAFLYQDIYIDGESIKSQLYLYNPAGFWKYTWNETDFSGSLSYVPFYNESALKTCDDLFAYGDDLLNQIIRSEDLNIMSGDILKAYGNDGIIKLAAVPEYVALLPKYDVAVLEQFKNATVLGYTQTTTMGIGQSPNKGYLIHTPKVAFTSDNDLYNTTALVNINALAESRIMTTEVVDPQPELVMENTRLMSFVSDVTTNDETHATTGSVNGGSELVISGKLFKYATDSTGNVYSLETFPLAYSEAVYTGNAAGIVETSKKDAARLPFKYAPAVHRFIIRDGSTSGSYNFADGDILYDIDNYTILHTSDILRLHNAALLNLLNVPSVAKLR